jgi:hypothetical protein
MSGVYDVWRDAKDIVFVEIHFDAKDNPLGFPRELLHEDLLGSPTIWPYPDVAGFIWWHTP